MGGNIGDRMAFLESAKTKISLSIGKIDTCSQIYESEAWGVENQNNFLNQALIIQTQLNPEKVLEKCLKIEKSLGRERLEKWTERVIDIDILYFENEIINDENLTIPHPEIENRRFVLKPLCELSPSYIHPISNKTNHELLKKCQDNLEVWEYEQ